MSFTFKGTAGQTIEAMDGSTYTADANGIISGVDGSDVSSFITAGLQLLPTVIPVPVSITALTAALTAAAHAGRQINLNKVDGQTITLPAALGTGNEYPINIGTTVTSVGTVIQVANATDIIQGSVTQTGATGAATNFAAGASDDTLTLNGSTKGGFKGDTFTFVDVAAGLWQLKDGVTKITSTAATPFSAAVS